jgi:hypothetical protein
VGLGHGRHRWRVTAEGREQRKSAVVVREAFWASTSNKQLTFVKHIKTLLQMQSKAAVVVPDNVLFGGGDGETVRRKLLQKCDVHTCCACRPASVTLRVSRPTYSSSTAGSPAPRRGPSSCGSMICACSVRVDGESWRAIGAGGAFLDRRGYER